MKKIQRDKKTIAFSHTELGYYLKARRRGFTTLWVGEGLICMFKIGKRS